MFDKGTFSGKVAKIVILMLALVSLAACQPRPVHYTPTPTVEPQVAPSPTLVPTAVVPTPAPTLTPTPVVSGPTKLRMDPSVMLDLPVGETRLVQMWLENVEGLQSIEVHIGFEPRYVQIEDADPDVEGEQIQAGDFPVPAQVVRNEANNDSGFVVYHVTAASPVSGSGVVASFAVRGHAEGGSPGLVSVSAGGPAPEPTEAAPPISTPVAVTPTPVPPTPSSAGPVYHTVQAGENLYRISLRYGTTVDAIVAANNLPNANSVYVGQVLLIPVGGQAQPGPTTYVVQPGDTLYAIARRFGTTVDALAAHNGIAPPYAIMVGQTLRIP
jgi:LysM repeat protein